MYGPDFSERDVSFFVSCIDSEVEHNIYAGLDISSEKPSFRSMSFLTPGLVNTLLKSKIRFLPPESLVLSASLAAKPIFWRQRGKRIQSVQKHEEE